jgi:hypothetical protein
VIQEDGANSSDEEQETTKDFISKLNFDDPAAANILNEERLDEALEAIQNKKKLSPLDQKILLGLVSRAPQRYTDQLAGLGRKDIAFESSSSSSSENPESFRRRSIAKKLKEKMDRLQAESSDSKWVDQKYSPGKKNNNIGAVETNN